MRTLLQPYPLLLALCGTLGALVAYELWAPLAAPDVPHLNAAALVLAAPAAMPVMAPASTFSIIVERPLFDAQRKKFVAPKSAQTDAGAPPPLPNIALVGIIIDNEKSLAILRSADAAFASSLAVGDSVGAWRLSAIQPDRVILTAGPNRNEIRLDASKGTPAPIRQDQSGPAAITANDTAKPAALP
jgi:type II secretory pathway component PulC